MNTDELAKPEGHGRRRFILHTTIAAAALPLAGAAPVHSLDGPIRAIAFDAFPIFDPRSVFTAAKIASSEQGEAFAQLWFQKIFTDTWLRTSARQYLPFEAVAAECLDYACRATALTLHKEARSRLLSEFWNLAAWPDVTDQLNRLRMQGVRLALLSNMSGAMLRANMRRNGLDTYFETVLTTDTVRAFKPAPEAYALGISALGLRKQDIGFAAFAAWDAAGASWFGYNTVWVNRQAQQPEPGAPAVRTGHDLSVVARLLDSPG